ALDRRGRRNASVNPLLAESLQRVEAHFRQDARCVAMYLWGSLGKGTADAFSDVDAALAIRDADYASMRDELPGICGPVCGKILVWLPEGESPDACNYAFLFESGDHLLLYDLTITKVSALSKSPAMSPKRVLFDREGVLEGLASSAPSSAVAAKPKLRLNI